MARAVIVGLVDLPPELVLPRDVEAQARHEVAVEERDLEHVLLLVALSDLADLLERLPQPLGAPDLPRRAPDRRPKELARHHLPDAQRRDLAQPDLDLRLVLLAHLRDRVPGEPHVRADLLGHLQGPQDDADREENSTVLHDVVSASFKMRKMVYNLAKSQAVGYRRVILSVGTRRFQEINEMDLKNFSYIVVDPEIDLSRLSTGKEIKTIVRYDIYTSMLVQIKGITSKPGNILYFKGKFSDFLNTGDIFKTITTLSLPSVFSFSLSFCSAEVSLLKSNGVPVYGGGYVHDHLPVCGLGKAPVTMSLERDQYRNSCVVAVFGKSTYNEPIFLSTHVKGLRKLSDVMPELDSEIDLETKQILDRAVILV
ncbi:hypothetical protein E4U61_003502 [Claviceps capensis]|nr:hypothetical protein E4U61_003502 [Claviceps capensis]